MPLSPAMRRSPRFEPPPADGFGSTEWSLVLMASVDGGPALDRLCRAYWRPVYVFIRAAGLPRHEAEDATQEFFADMLRREWLKLADRERGSFRAFLRSSVRLFLNNRRRTASAQKRGSGEHQLPLDTAQCEAQLATCAIVTTDPAMLYEQSWADCVLKAALARLAAENATADKRTRFDRLRPFLTAAPAAGDYEQIARELEMTPGQVAVSVHRLARRFAEMIRAEIATTLSDRREVEPELRHLLRVVSRQN
jgi:DNA-directed RNA polymerase specialized sigma24 family protein